MRSTGAVITEIVEGYAARGNGWVSLTEIADGRGLTREELTEAITELLEDDEFRAEPQPFGHRITARDKDLAPIIGGEARHLIRWGA
jgi:hypothetical protein